MPGSASEYPFPQKWQMDPLDYFPTPEGFDIYYRLLPEWAGRFAIGQEKYQDVEHLGARGVFPDVNRKTGRLRSDIWLERMPPIGAEPTRVVILDMIGHLFLMLHLWDHEPLHGTEERLNAMGLESIPEDPDAEPGGRREPLYRDEPLADYKVESDGRLVPLSDRALGIIGPGNVVPYYGAEDACPNPHAHGDGWEDLPHAAREVLRRVAASERVSDVERNQVRILVEQHDASQPD
jgi:hypothetical protein